MTTLEEQKAHRREWVKALRSGDFEQGSNYLRLRDDKFCCLGVLAQIAGCEWSLPDGDSHYETGGDNQYCPTKAMEFVGLRSSDGEMSHDIYSSLTSANDCGETFFEIADIIESEPEGLFVTPPSAGDEIQTASEQE